MLEYSADAPRHVGWGGRIGVQDLEEEFPLSLRPGHYPRPRLAFFDDTMVPGQGNVRATFPLGCLSRQSRSEKTDPSCSILPARYRPADKDYTVHRMLIGTHTSDNDNNYVQIATVHLPKPDSELNLEKYDDERGGEPGSVAQLAQRLLMRAFLPHARD